jgi:hypothetical protein
MAILYFIIGYILCGCFLVWRDFRMDVVDRPVYISQNPSLKMIAYAIITRPYQTPLYLINNIILDFKRSLEDDKRKNEERLAREKRINEQALKDIKKIDFFKQNVKNANLIEKADGIMPISGNHIGEIIINKKNKTAMIEVKQCTEPQIIAYYEGHLLCKNAEYETGNTEINSGLFLLKKDETDPSKYKIQLNNNRWSIIIKCSEIELVNYQEIKKPIEEYKNIYTGLLWGKFFSIKIND